MTFETGLEKSFGEVQDFVVDKVIPAANKVAGLVGNTVSSILGADAGVFWRRLGGVIRLVL